MHFHKWLKSQFDRQKRAGECSGKLKSRETHPRKAKTQWALDKWSSIHLESREGGVGRQIFEN